MVIISMMVLYNATATTEYNGRRAELPSAPQDMEYDNTSMQQ